MALREPQKIPQEQRGEIVGRGLRTCRPSGKRRPAASDRLLDQKHRRIVFVDFLFDGRHKFFHEVVVAGHFLDQGLCHFHIVRFHHIDGDEIFNEKKGILAKELLVSLGDSPVTAISEIIVVVGMVQHHAASFNSAPTERLVTRGIARWVRWVIMTSKASRDVISTPMM